jgi:hypothetical protein
MPRARSIAWYSSSPPPIVPWSASIVTIIFAPGSRGVEPLPDATVTVTAS